MTEPARYDLLVIGGGATGLGCALDAAQRGYRVAVVERGDLAGETSSRSTKLVHGGVRYLERAVLHADREQFVLVREALRERALLRRLAPHLVVRRTLVTPAPSSVGGAYLWAGLQAYDRLAGRRSFGASRWIAAAERRTSYPQLRGAGPAVAYTDGAFDDARFAVALALSARARGARVLTHTAVTALTTRADGAVAELHDRLTDQRWELRARAVINATGPFADRVRRLADPQLPEVLRPSSGIHLVFDRRWWPHANGLLIPRTRDGRVLFALPWQGHLLVGTTDEAATAGFDPPVSAAAVDYLLAHLREHLDPAPPASAIRARWCGLRPLVAAGAGSTAALSRDHSVLHEAGCLVTVVGGKWTTYRLMARDAVDRAAVVAGLPQRSCRSSEQVLAGGERDPRRESAWQSGLPLASVRHLAAAYGARAPLVAEYCQGERAEPLLTDWPYLRGELRYLVEHEWARTVEDLLHRRLRLGMLDERAAAHCREAAAAALAAAGP